MNSLSLTKGVMLAKTKEAVFKINKANTLYWLPAIEIEKKVPTPAK